MVWSHVERSLGGEQLPPKLGADQPVRSVEEVENVEVPRENCGVLVHLGLLYPILAEGPNTASRRVLTGAIAYEDSGVLLPARADAVMYPVGKLSYPLEIKMPGLHPLDL